MNDSLQPPGQTDLAETSRGNLAGADTVLRLLDSEIDHLRAERAKGGWTTWALAVALAAVLALAADVWEKGHVSLRVAALLFALFSVLADFVIPPIFDPKSAPPEGHGRFRVGSYLGWKPVAIMIYAFRWILVAAAAWFALGMVSPWVTWLLIGWYGFIALSTIAIAITAARNYPIRTFTTGETSQVIGVIISIVVAVTIIAYVIHLGILSSGRPLDDVRFAVLMLISVYLTMYLLMDRHREPLLTSLIDIRRAVALGDLDLTGAIRRAKIVLTGLAAGDWIQRDLQSLLQAHDRQVVNDRSARDLAQLSGNEMTELERLVAAGTKDSVLAASIRGRLVPIGRLVSESTAAHNEVLKRSSGIAGRFGFLGSSVGGVGEQEKAYRAAIDPLVDDAIKRDVELRLGYQQFCELLNARLAAIE